MDVVTPPWAERGAIRAFTTTRAGGVSRDAYAGLNLATHVADDIDKVAQNRTLLLTTHGLPRQPQWLRQVHGNHTIDLMEAHAANEIEADAAYTNLSDHVCAILTADCLPILLCDDGAEEVAAIHAGWRGLFNGVIPSAVAKFRTPAARLSAWIGPGIGIDAYAVNREFRERFLSQDPTLSGAFDRRQDQWHADLYAIAEHRLIDCGVRSISRYGGCTFAEQERFYSYRRDGVTGRMATLIWIDSRHHNKNS